MSGNTDLMKVGQCEADRLLKHSLVFRVALGTHSGSLSPVLSGWALGAVQRRGPALHQRHER